ncbi:MAG: AAA family ATPase, partial [Myxococcales bacterium]|nr:AAA family ATPase [Myxococcales bacterium]
MRARFAALGDALRARFVERDALIDAALCALVCGQHLLIIGPPGTAKSQLATALCEALEGATGFQWLLTRFTTPEELFGPISLKGLEEDRYVRLTAGKLPTAQIVFLDEVFKASSAILNALLTVLNERRFHNDARAEPVPLITLIGASNELPDEDDELQALYDRFLVRVMVDYVEADYRFVKLLTLGEPGPLPMVTLADLAAAG